MDAAVKNRIRAFIPGFLLTSWRRVYWWRRSRISPRRARQRVRKWLAAGGPVRLEIGSGPRLPGWITLDRNFGAHVQHDLLDPLPFPDGSVDEIYSSHVLEHFQYPHPMIAIVRECHRVLKPGGTLRVAVPDASIFVRAYCGDGAFDVSRYCAEPVGLSFRSRMDILNFIAYLGGDHKHLFDAENLVEVLAEAGFGDARTRSFDAAIDRPERRHESVYAVATK
jgi:predicted SAM-dependent methyltransferase